MRTRSGRYSTSSRTPWAVAAYVIGITAASWHFAYGLWLFAAKWGLTVGDNARRKFGYVCTALAVVLIVIGLWTINAFFAGTAGSGVQLQPETYQNTSLH